MKLLEITPLDVDNPDNDEFVKRMQRFKLSKQQQDRRDRRKSDKRKKDLGRGEWHVRYNDRLSIYELVTERFKVTPSSSDSDIVSALSDAIRTAEYKLEWSDAAIEASEDHLAQNQRAWVEEYRDHVTKLYNRS